VYSQPECRTLVATNVSSLEPRTKPEIRASPRSLLLTILFLAAAITTSVTAKPNVLFLAVDDMKDWVNCLGGYEGTVHTPNIDRLAKRGTLFTNAHCASPKCAPSRAAIMTGLRPSTTGLYDNGHWWKPNFPKIDTIPMHFRKHGYTVAGAGKIFHHTAGNNPLGQWDDFQRLVFRDDPWYRSVKLNYPWSKVGPYPKGFPFSKMKGLPHENDWGSLPIEEAEYDDTGTADYVINFLKSHPGPRAASAKAGAAPHFFLACGLFRPHLPWYAPKKYFDLYPLKDVVLPKVKADDLEDIPTAGKKFAKARQSDLEKILKADRWRQAVQAYLASISFADAQVGRVLDALDASPHAKNTIVMLWSDHGWHLGEKGHWHKSTLWEEATRIPFIVAAPGMKPGRYSKPVSLIDIYPTLNELAGLKPNPSHDGTSLVPLLRNPRAKWNRPAMIQYGSGNVAIRSERHRYIRYRNGGEELYDLKTDPYEWHNLAADPNQQKVKAGLAKWLPKTWAKSAPTKRAFEFDPHAFTWKNKESGKVISGARP
jgi:arylsulfatase A-like enzyme